MNEAVSLPDRHASNLINAYVGRKTFEAKTIWAALGEGLKGSQDKSGGTMSLQALSMVGFGVR